MSYKNLKPDQVEEFLATSTPIVLDQRDASTYARSHLPGAMQVHDQLIMQMIKKDKQTPVLVYCYRGNSSRDLASFLVNLGFRDVYNLEGGWQAWSACHEQKQATVSSSLTKWMLDYGFDASNLNSRIDNGMSPLMQAAMLAEKTFLLELINAGADINLRNDDENNALWFACVSEDQEIIAQLLLSGIDVNNSNINGATALIYAASAGKFEVVKQLIEAGADIHHSTLDGFNALDSAATLPILKYLKPKYKAA